MENLLLFLAASLSLQKTTLPRLKRYRIGQSGCSTLLHPQNTTLYIRHTKGSDTIYFNEYSFGGVTYGIICVKMCEAYRLYNAKNILTHYLKRVRKPFRIAHNFSMEIEKTYSLVTVTDYWQDEAGMDWKIKGYTNGKLVVLLYVKNINDASVKYHDAFLSGLRFSAAVKK